MFYLTGVGLAFFLSLLLLSKKGKTPADKILAGWLLIVTLHLFFYYLVKTEQFVQWWGPEIPMPLMHGPFLYLYTRALTNRNQSLTISALHFTPALAEYIYIAHFLILPAEQKLFVYQHQGAGYETFNSIHVIIVGTSGVVYIMLASLALLKHRQSIVQQFSSTDKINLQWLQYLIYWITLIWIFVIFGNDDLVFGASVLFVLFIGFFGIRQAGIFTSVIHQPNTTLSPETENESPETSEKRKYQKSGLSNEASENLHQLLAQTMLTEKLFRESELSLAELASRLKTHPNYLSQVINEREGKNFYDYINTLRIEEFMRLAAGPESRKYTLLALAQECGFSSKSSFNRHFKKVTGQSPSEFLQTSALSEK